MKISPLLRKKFEEDILDESYHNKFKMKKKQYVTYGMDNMGNLHLFKGKKRITLRGDIFVDAKGKEADQFIQGNEVQEILENLGVKDLGIDEWDTTEDKMGYF